MAIGPEKNILVKKGFFMNKVKRLVHYYCADTLQGHIKGQNVAAAVLDTGIAPHPDLKGRVAAFEDCVNGRTGLYDDSGHGTHVAGILAGDGRMSKGLFAGMAPEAKLCIIKVLNERGEGDIGQILSGLEWIERHQGPLGIRIVNISVGAKAGIDKEKERRLLGAVERLWDRGLTVVVSAGNYGPERGTVAVPGTSRKVITVGALKEGNAPGCSGNGPTGECIVKPDVVAPGYQITSCSGRFGRARGAYTVKSGSSMATPVVSGAVAALLSKYPDMGNVEIKLKLRGACDRMPAKEETGWGMLRVDRLLACGCGNGNCFGA